MVRDVHHLGELSCDNPPAPLFSNIDLDKSGIKSNQFPRMATSKLPFAFRDLAETEPQFLEAMPCTVKTGNFSLTTCLHSRILIDHS